MAEREGEAEAKAHAEEHGCIACGSGELVYLNDHTYALPPMYLFNCRECGKRIAIGRASKDSDAIRSEVMPPKLHTDTARCKDCGEKPYACKCGERVK